jgi:pilus retraction protein PilT
MELNLLCRSAVAANASDLLLHEGAVPRIRVAGAVQPLGDTRLLPSDFDRFWAEWHADPDCLDHDTSYISADNFRFRVSLLRQLGRRAAVLRWIRSDVRSIEDLALPAPLLDEWISRRNGIILVTGPTGSGKSTTLAACLERLNQSAALHIVTIEDPIEFVFTPRLSVFTQREIGIDTPGFAEGLRHALRQSPDVIFIGEIRDSDSAATAVHAAETGHLIRATVHGAGAADAIERVERLFPVAERESLRKVFAAQVIGVFAQRLLPAKQGGVIPAVEFFTNIGATRNYIERNRLGELSNFIDRSDGSSAAGLMQNIAALCRAGLVTEEAASAAVDSPAELSRVLRGISETASRHRR